MSFIDQLIQQGYLKTPAIIKAFRKINRQDFVLERDRANADINAPLSIGFGQTISQPLTVAFMIELLQPKTGDKILDVGCGSGWTTALLAEITGGKGKVFGVERIRELKDFAVINVSKYNFIKHKTAQIFYSDGYHGLPELAPFDKILVSAAASALPYKLFEQLKAGGRLAIPLGEPYGAQDIALVEKIDDKSYNEKRYPGFIFVPLIKDN